MTSFAGPIERVAAALGTPWNELAVVVDAGGAPIGLAAPGDTDCGTFGGSALDGVVEVRRLRRDPVTARLSLERVAVGDAGAALDRLEIVAEVALDGRGGWRALQALLHEVARAAAAGRRVFGLGRPDARGRARRALGATTGAADALDERLIEALEFELAAFVRAALASADAGAARGGSLAHAIAPSLPTPIGGPFAALALRVDRASWAGEPTTDESAGAAAVAESAPGSAAPDDVASAVAAVVDESAGASAVAGFATTPAMPDDVADAPFEQVLGSSPVLAAAWARESGGDRVTAIGAVIHDGEATILALHPDPERVVVTGSLVAALGAELDVVAPRLFLLREAATLRELLNSWLVDQALPDGVDSAVIVDGPRRRVVLELSGAEAAPFVERIAESSAVDLAALGAVLPWSVSLRAMGERGLVEADGSGRVFTGAGEDA